MLFLLIVTLVSMLIAAVMSIVAWKFAQEERRRADARIAALAAEIHSTEPIAPAPASRIADFDIRHADVPPVLATPTDMFETTRRGGLAVPLIVGIGALVFVIAAGAAITLGRGSSATAAPSRHEELANPEHLANPAQPATPAAPLAPMPALELLALGHERDGERLTVRGVVRNPSRASIGSVTAVVFLFDRNGSFLTSGRAAVDSGTLTPGGESTFIVTVPGAAAVGRYRVSFRTADRVVPHVDRRDHLQAKS
jgi:flagellar basal body-associated protein FliL